MPTIKRKVKASDGGMRLSYFEIMLLVKENEESRLKKERIKVLFQSAISFDCRCYNERNIINSDLYELIQLFKNDGGELVDGPFYREMIVETLVSMIEKEHYSRSYFFPYL